MAASWIRVAGAARRQRPRCRAGPANSTCAWSTGPWPPPGLTNLAFSPDSLGIRGAGRGLQLALLGNDYDELNEQTATLVAAMQGDPAFVNPQLSQDASQPQIDVSIDRDMATQLGLAPEAVAATINMLTEGIVAQEVFIGGEETEILLQPGAAPVRNPQDIESVFMRTSGGKFVPRGMVALSMPRPAWERPPHGCRKSRPRCCRRMCASPCAARPPR